MSTPIVQLIAALDKRIEHWLNVKDDSHNIALPVSTALQEVRNALVEVSPKGIDKKEGGT